jgi:hypothetical protein
MLELYILHDGGSTCTKTRSIHLSMQYLFFFLQDQENRSHRLFLTRKKTLSFSCRFDYSLHVFHSRGVHVKN